MFDSWADPSGQELQRGYRGLLEGTNFARTMKSRASVSRTRSVRRALRQVPRGCPMRLRRLRGALDFGRQRRGAFGSGDGGETELAAAIDQIDERTGLFGSLAQDRGEDADQQSAAREWRLGGSEARDPGSEGGDFVVAIQIQQREAQLQVGVGSEQQVARRFERDRGPLEQRDGAGVITLLRGALAAEHEPFGETSREWFRRRVTRLRTARKRGTTFPIERKRCVVHVEMINHVRCPGVPIRRKRRHRGAKRVKFVASEEDVGVAERNCPAPGVTRGTFSLFFARPIRQGGIPWPGSRTCLAVDARSAVNWSAVPNLSAERIVVMPRTTPPLLAAVLRHLREESDWTQSQLEARAELGPGIVSKLERGAQCLGRIEVERLAQVMGFDESWIDRTLAAVEQLPRKAAPGGSPAALTVPESRAVEALAAGLSRQV